MDILLQYGVLGMFSVILLGAVRMLLTRERTRADKVEAEWMRLNAKLQENATNALLASIKALGEADKEIRRELSLQRRRNK